MQQRNTQRSRPPTIREVAQLAGVSHQTVARYIRFSGSGVKPASRERIQAAIDELDYRPNLLARAMRSRHTGAVAIVLPQGSAMSSLEILEGATRLADQADRRLEVVFVGGQLDARTERVLEMSRSGLYDGIVSLIDLDTTRIEALHGGCQVAVTALYDDHMRGVGELADASAIVEIVEELARLGHRRFVHVAGDLAHASARSRRDTYLATIDRLDLESHGVVDSDWSGEAGLQTVLGLPADRSVTALIAANDVIAAGAARGALQRGWRVPEDLSITGWDAHPLGDWLMPSITTVAMDHVGLGSRVMRQLLIMLQDDIPELPEEPISSVVWRESTGSARQER